MPLLVGNRAPSTFLTRPLLSSARFSSVWTPLGVNHLVVSQEIVLLLTSASCSHAYLPFHLTVTPTVVTMAATDASSQGQDGQGYVQFKSLPPGGPLNRWSHAVTNEHDFPGAQVSEVWYLDVMRC